MGLKKIDRLLLVVGAVLVVFSGFQLFLAGGLSQVDNILGELTSKHSIVKTKYPGSLDWRDAATGNPLGDNQLIYTDEDSSAEVSFLTGDQISISSSALVKIREQKGINSLEIKKGHFRTTLKSGSPFRVGFNGEEYVLQSHSAEILISMGGIRGEIGVASGEVSLMAGEKSFRLDSSRALDISPEGIKETRIGIKLTSPALNEVIYTDKAIHLVTFNWVPDLLSEMHLAHDPSFANEKVISASSGHKENLGPGLWFWKIKGKESSSLTGQFRIVQETAPELLRPLHGEEINVLENKDGISEIVLQWKGNEGNYEVEWKQEITYRSSVSSTRFSLPCKPGRLEWRVRALDKARPNAPWSPWQSITIKTVPFPSVPTDLFPHEVEFQNFNEGNQMVEMNWKSSHPVLWEMENPSGSKNQKLVSVTYLSESISVPGTYKWRVRGTDNERRESAWTEWRTFTLMDLSREKDEVGVYRIQLKRPDQEVTFTWESPKGSSDIFELSTDQKFTNVIVRKELSEKSTKVHIPKVGTYFWRSRQFHADGKFSVSSPVRVIVEPSPAPQKPTKAPDLEVPMEWRVREEPKSTWIDWIISSAYADEDLMAIVKIKVPKTENIRAHKIRIFRDQNLSDLIIEEQFEGNVFEWENVRAGTYFWQYAVVDFWDRTSPFSDPSTLVIKDSPVLKQPKLQSPIRAVEVERKDIVLHWTEAGEGVEYKVEVSDRPDFEKIIFSTNVKNTQAKVTSELEPKLHFWRILAKKNTSEILSNTGRFSVMNPAPILEPKTAVPAPEKKEKEHHSRVMLTWAPSLDNYSFEANGKKGEIDGTVMNGVEIKGVHFKAKSIFMAEIFRQSGKVFDSESYLFQRFLVSSFWNFSLWNGKFGAGVALGHSSGVVYEIENSVASGKSVSGLSYGPTLIYFLPWSRIWEFQGKINYFLGEIKQLDVLAEILHHSEKFFMIGGAGISTREYELNSGKLSSLRVSVGIGKEF